MTQPAHVFFIARTPPQPGGSASPETPAGRSKSRQAGDGNGLPRGGGADGGSRGVGTVVVATAASAVIATAIGFEPLSPILFASSGFPYFYALMRRGRVRTSLGLAFRWGIVLFVALLTIGVFVPERLAQSLPFEPQTATALETWVKDNRGGPDAYAGLFWVFVAFLAGTLLSGGLLGFVIAAVALGSSAFGALFVLRHGLNLFQAAIVAVPFWRWSLLLAAVFLLVPAGLPFYARFFGTTVDADGRRELRRYMWIGLALLLVALALRLATGGLWRTLLTRWTLLG